MSRSIRVLAATVLLVLGVTGILAEQEKTAADQNPTVVMKTSKGTVEIELWPDKAPITVENFLGYVDKGAYDGTIFHRVIKGFMIQGGGLDKSMKPRPVGAPIKNEADNGLKNVTGTIAMARTSVVDSATTQFFINTVDNTNLDHTGPGVQEFGYAVFGKVVSGMDAVKAIEATPTASRAGIPNVPSETVVIESIKRK